MLPISWRLKKPVGIQELRDNQLVPRLSQRASGPSSGPPGLHIHLRVFPPEPIVHEKAALRQDDWPFRPKHVVALPFRDTKGSLRRVL